MGLFFSLSNFLFCHVTFWHSIPKPLPALDQVKTPTSSKFQTNFDFYSIYLILKTISAIIYGPRWFAKELQVSFWVLTPNKLL